MTEPIHDITNLCFFDDETRSFSGTKPPLNSVVTAGTYAYAKLSFPIVRTYAIGDGPVQCLEHLDFDDEYGLTWEQMPDDLKRHYERAYYGKAWFAAWNAGFDRASWNAAVPIGNPVLKPEYVIDVMAQAVASNLPPALQGASKAIGRGGKQDDGKMLINLFCSPDGATPQSRPAEWELFKSYAVRDTDELRAVWHATRKLPLSEWQEYWASEEINDRGFDIDLDFARRCNAIADLNANRSNKKLDKLTAGVVTKVTQRERIADWVYDRLEHAEAREMMVKEYDEESEEELKAAKIGVSRDRIEALLAFFSALEEKEGLTDTEIAICEALEIRQWDGSSAPGKFAKMLDHHDAGKLKGSYVFNGAGQTGRFCVARETMVDTPTGKRQIVNLRQGDEVITHLGRARRVTHLHFKGYEVLYRLSGPAGEHVTATLAHRILTPAGWHRIDECFEKSAEGCWRLRGGRTPVSLAGEQHSGDRDGVGDALRQRRGGHPAGAGRGRAEAPEPGVPIPVKDGRKEPDARREEGGRPDHAGRLHRGVERGGVHVRAPQSRGLFAWLNRAAAALGDTPHRRGQDKQQPGQLSDSNEVRSPETTQETVWSIVCMGEGEVWDITVEGDASYTAGGLIHHNSSKGVQVHNLPNKFIGLETKDKQAEARAIEMINALEI